MRAQSRLLRGDTLHMEYGVETGPSYWFENPHEPVSSKAIQQHCATLLEGLSDNLFGDTAKSQSFKASVTGAIDLIRIALRRQRFVISSESTLQDEIASALTASHIPFEREYRLAARDRIDFLIGRIGVEVKIKGTKRGILRQLQRYAESPAIAGLLLVSNVSTGLPEMIEGKPVHFLSLGEAWL